MRLPPVKSPTRRKPRNREAGTAAPRGPVGLSPSRERFDGLGLCSRPSASSVRMFLERSRRRAPGRSFRLKAMAESDAAGLPRSDAPYRPQSARHHMAPAHLPHTCPIPSPPGGEGIALPHPNPRGPHRWPSVTEPSATGFRPHLFLSCGRQLPTIAVGRRDGSVQDRHPSDSFRSSRPFHVMNPTRAAHRFVPPDPEDRFPFRADDSSAPRLRRVPPVFASSAGAPVPSPHQTLVFIP